MTPLRSPARLAFAALVGTSLVAFLAPLGEPAGPDGSDKVVHLAVFATLTVAGRWARFPAVPLVLGLAAYAALVEVVQGTVTALGRAGDVRDLLADLVGIGVGLVVAAAVGLSRR